MGKDKNKDKEHHDGETSTSETNSPQDTCQDSRRDLSQDREARDATLAQTIASNDGSKKSWFSLNLPPWH